MSHLAIELKCTPLQVGNLTSWPNCGINRGNIPGDIQVARTSKTMQTLIHFLTLIVVLLLGLLILIKGPARGWEVNRVASIL